MDLDVTDLTIDPTFSFRQVLEEKNRNTGSIFPGGRGSRGVGLISHSDLVPKVLEKSRAIPLLILRTCVAYKTGGNLPTIP